MTRLSDDGIDTYRRAHVRVERAVTFAIVALFVGAAIAVWMGRAPGEPPPWPMVWVTVLVAAGGLALDQRYLARTGIRIAPHGFRPLAGDADWTPWSTVAAITLQPFRERIVLRGADGRRLIAVGLGLERVTELLARIVDACPQALRPQPLPATFRPPARYRWFIAGMTAFGAVVLPALTFVIARAVAGTALDLTSRPATIAGAAAAVVVAIGLAAFGTYEWRKTVHATTIDADGITVHHGGRERRIPRDMIRRIDLAVTWRSTGDSGSYVVDVQVDDGSDTPRTVSPRHVDALAVLSTALAMLARDGSGRAGLG